MSGIEKWPRKKKLTVYQEKVVRLLCVCMRVCVCVLGGGGGGQNLFWFHVLRGRPAERF
jgi:hypothetical protein